MRHKVGKDKLLHRWGGHRRRHLWNALPVRPVDPQFHRFLKYPIRGRGRTPDQLPGGFSQAANVTEADSEYFLRPQGQNGLDSYAFHYSIYRSLTRFLGMDGNLAVAYDLDSNFITAWNEMFVDDDFLNANNGVIDPKHMFGASNFDLFRWPSLENGTMRSALGLFITNLIMPGMTLVRPLCAV